MQESFYSNFKAGFMDTFTDNDANGFVVVMNFVTTCYLLAGDDFNEEEELLLFLTNV